MYADNMQQIFAKALNVPAVSTSNRELLAAYHARGKVKRSQVAPASAADGP